MKTRRGATFGATILALPHLRIVSDTDDCIEWTGARSSAGYGVFSLGRRQIKAHRIFWEWANQQRVPLGCVVMHLCDNPSCVNPKHLRLGSPYDNVSDCNRKGRRNQVTGERHGMAKLTVAQVQEIRRRYVPRSVTLETLGREYGVHMSTIHQIVRGEKWAVQP